MNSMLPHIRAAALLSALLLVGLVTDATAQPNGPLQPEFSTPSAPAGPQVNTFTGGFSFGLPVLTVPGPNGSDYSLNLSYNSGTPVEQGASWVGYGWSLNAGAVVRDVKGFPDDWKNSVKIWNKINVNWTASASVRGGIEAASKDLGIGGSAAYQRSVSYNNATGYRRTEGFGLDAKGIADIYWANSDGQQSWSGHVNPSILTTQLTALRVPGALSQTLSGTAAIYADKFVNNNLFHHEYTPPAQISPHYDGESKNFGAGVTIALLPWFPLGVETGGAGNYTSRTMIAHYRINGTGLLYSSVAGASDLRDYVSEKNGEYRVDDNFLPIPFTGADEYFVSGGAPVGGLRLFSQRSGQFRPDYVHNYFKIWPWSLERTFGFRIGMGGSLGYGYHSLTISDWDAGDLNAEYRFDSLDGDEPYFFRYGNDLGGNVIKAHDDKAVQAEVQDDGPKITTNIFALMNEGQRSGRSIYVGYNLNKKLADTTDLGVHYHAYEKLSLLTSDSTLVNRTESAIADQIGELAVIGQGGYRYVYGLPVYARMEKRLNFGVGRVAADSAATRIQARHIVYSWVDTSSANIIIGQERDAPYATAHLLTLITTPDYVDLTHNGPTPDDLGGYIKFNYERTAGSPTKSDTGATASWYHWRVPQSGLFYSRNSLSDPDDDMGSCLAGEREQYYLQSIETKTHVAILVNNYTALLFGGRLITGSQRQRSDAYQAPFPNTYVGANYMMEAAGDSTASYAQWYPKDQPDQIQIPNIARRLERIELYTKDSLGAPDSLLSTVRFDYDYSLRPGMPNAITEHPDSTARPGMLTLKRVWVESQRVHNARISPYEFGYEYKPAADYPASARALYPAVAHFADLLSAEEQNPRYSPLQIDRWGAYQYRGAELKTLENPWVDQNPDSTTFDPAAWQLKSVRTPSQGELQIHYEQAEYSYVQDKPALAMVSLKRTFGDSLSTDGNDNGRYYLNMDDLGVADTNRALLFRYRSLMKKLYVDTNDRILCRLLYALVGDTAKFGDPAFNSEYITAYARAQSVGVDSIVGIGGTKHYALYVKFGLGEYSVPKRVCLNFVKWNKRGRLQPGDPIPSHDHALESVWGVMKKYGEAGWDPDNHCEAVDYAHSYVRIPTLAPKKGGGIRVKRLLTFDKGIEHDSTLYGTEYIYTKYDEDRREYVSSGVAANEPSTGREENALVNVDPARGRSKFAIKIIAGDDRAQYEGPLGESLLPGASVGYSRVVTKNIYPGKTNPGFAVQEFFTTKDFPFVSYDSLYGKSADYTGIAQQKDQEGFLWNLLSGAVGASGSSGDDGSLGFGFKKSSPDLKLTQGYRFILNSMNGQPKSSASYGGDFDRPDSWALSGLSEYGYFRPGEKIPVVHHIGDSIGSEDLGKEMEVTFDSRWASDHTTDLTVNADVSESVFPPWTPFVSAAATLEIQDNDLHTHVTSKVIRYPAIQKSVLTYADGIYHMAENVAFDPESGTPLISKTVDGYDKLTLEQSPDGHNGEYHSYAIPATQEYPLVGQKAANQRALIINSAGLTISKAALDSGAASLAFSNTFPDLTYRALARLYPGDLIHLIKVSGGDDRGFYHVASKSGTTVLLHPVSATNFASHNTQTGPVNIEVLESGRANASGSSIAGITTYGESDSLVRTAGNFYSVEPTEFSPRRRFVDTLNAVLARGGGFITPALVSGISVKFLRMITDSTDTCAALSDTLRLQVRDGQVVLSRGAFSWNDSTCGTPLSPHPLVVHLNHLLDSLWGCHIDTSFAALSQCDSTTYSYRHYDSMCAPCKAFMDSMQTIRFDCINYRDNYWVGDLVYVQRAMDTLFDGFKRGTNGYYSMTGAIDLKSVLDSTQIQARLWVSDCDTTHHIHDVSFRLATTLVGPSAFDSTKVYSGATKARIDSFFTYTSTIGKFKENNFGELIYQNLFYSGAGGGKIFGVRFKHSDTIATRLVCADTVARVGGNGHFDLADDGSIEYVADNADVAVQNIPCLEFCPTVPHRYRTIDGVIAASAGTLDDSNVVDTTEYSFIPSDANSYERGARGKWRSRVGYVYRTSVIGGSEHYNDQRNYKDAGVFTSFRLYNFQSLADNDSVAWMKGDSVVKFSPDGVPLATRSPLGIHSAMRLDRANRLPIMVGANTEYQAIAFSSFEEDAGSQHLVTYTAHAGKYSRATGASEEISLDVRFKMTNQIRQKGELLRFWMKTDGTLTDTGTAACKIKLYIDGTPQEYPIRNANRIARTGEWSLYEIVANNLTPPNDTVISVTLKSNLSDSVFIDDIKAQPADAAAVCYVYDASTFRPLATFDNDHFGAYSQYNAEGRVVRTIVETARGIRTVAEAHAHTPMIDRPTTGDTMRTRERGGGFGYAVAHHSHPPIPDVEEGVDGSKVDLLDVELGNGKPKVKVLGGEKPKLPDPKSISVPDPSSIKAPDASGLAPKLPAVEQARLMTELKDLERQRRELAERGKKEMTAEERKALDVQRRLLEARRAELMRHLGITDSELQQLDNEVEGK